MDQIFFKLWAISMVCLSAVIAWVIILALLLENLRYFNFFFHYCEGNYIVVIALMAEISKGENPTLPDYVQPAAAIIDPGTP